MSKPTQYCTDPVFLGSALHVHKSTGLIKLSKVIEITVLNDTEYSIETQNTIYIAKFTDSVINETFVSYALHNDLFDDGPFIDLAEKLFTCDLVDVTPDMILAARKFAKGPQEGLNHVKH